ncbi:MAG: S8 family serine peptidase [Gemmatimonas sp.]
MPARKKAAPKKASTAKRAKRAVSTVTKPATKRSAKRPAASDETVTAKAVGTHGKKDDEVGAVTVIYVHGIGNKPIASVLKAQWDQALFEFDLGERSRLAYWVDRERYPKPIESVSSGGDYSDANEEAPQGEFSARAVREPWNANKELAALNLQIDELAMDEDGNPASAKHVARLRKLAESILSEGKMSSDQAYNAAEDKLNGDDGADIRRIQAQRYGVAAVQAKIFGFLPRPLRQWMTRRMTQMLLRDVNDLFVDKVKGDRMREALRERLRDHAQPGGSGPVVVIAHSQGTMISYGVLMEKEFADLDVRLFVTMGSPLGITEVQDFIRELPNCRNLQVPPNVRRWVNVSDPLDPVALDKNLSNEFKASARGVKIENHTKFNPDSPRHPHSATGYLALENVRQPVRESVDTSLFQPVARFKMAKDVVRSFADSRSQERHRILVQLEDFATSEMTRDDALKTIYQKLKAADPDSPQRRAIDPEELHRYVALNLTRSEAELLSSFARSDQRFPVARIWKNSAKWAYLDRSIHTTQAFPSHNSYKAMGAGVTWAVLDSGIHWKHPHFGGATGTKATISKVYDCTNPSQRRGNATLTPLDPKSKADIEAAADKFGHGAHVAGIIAGNHKATDKKGVERQMCGMAPDAKLVIYKVLDNNGSGEDSWIIKALDHIFETNDRAGRVVIHGVNLSLGGEFDVEAFNCGHTPLCVELRRLWRQGVVVVLAAGNEGFASLSMSDGDSVQANMGMSIGDPANLEESIVVGSVHKDNPHTYGTSFFSSRGPTADGRMKPDCVAPGERIYSVRGDASLGGDATFEQLYAEMSGTSMAAPHVSGLIAAFLSKRQEFMGRPDDVKRILLDHCTDLGRQRNMQGAGMPNLVKMLVNV